MWLSPRLNAVSSSGQTPWWSAMAGCWASPGIEPRRGLFCSPWWGRTHRVITGVAVVEAETHRAEVDTSATRVRMRAFDAEEAARYVASGEPLDKAGAYGIQGRGALLVEEIQGDYFTVVGLPLVLLAALLRRFGVDPWGREDAEGIPRMRPRERSEKGPWTDFPLTPLVKYENLPPPKRCGTPGAHVSSAGW